MGNGKARRPAFAIDSRPDEPLLDHLRQLLLVLTLLATDIGGVQDESGARGQGHHPVHHLLDRLGANLLATGRAVRYADRGEQEPQVVVNLGDRSHGRPGIPGGGLLLDGDCRRKTIYLVDVRVFDGALDHVQTIEVTVNPVNDPPTAQDKTIITPEDSTYTFALSDFGYNDVDGDPIALVRILPIYANIIELDGVSLDVQPGLVYGLVGANGAAHLGRHLADADRDVM